MTVELNHPYEQIAEQIMYAKGLPSIRAAIEQALEAIHASLTEEERTASLGGMVQAGFESGPADQSFDDFFDELLSDLRSRAQPDGKTEHAA